MIGKNKKPGPDIVVENVFEALDGRYNSLESIQENES